jgi:alkylation response protein AidB-like acyl-CoA dehydrogenase
MVRAESLALSEEGGVPVDIVGVEYFGHDQMVIARLNSGDLLKIRLSATIPLAVGQRVGALMPPLDSLTVLNRVAAVADRFAKDRPARQMRRQLVKEDFESLAEAGFLLTGVPADMGGLWSDIERSTRPIAEILRTLAQGDPSVALVCCMHPAVISFWLTQPVAPAPYTGAWEAQRRFVAQTALDGALWGTITSEPGSGGDVGRTKTLAKRAGEGFLISGQKHFGSGAGMSSYMITTAVPEGEDTADWFFLDLRGAAWDGSSGVKLISEWDGHGMIATQSHAFEFSDFPAVRLAWPGNLRTVSSVAGPFIASIFTAVVVGVVQSAFAAARAQILKRRDGLRPYEQVEWARAENEAWLIDQAYEGMLRAVEAKGSGAVLETLHAKTAIAELAESVTSRICRVIGGGSFHRASPFGAAFEDVRALGFLRPPWALAYDNIFDRTWERFTG